MGMRIEKWKQWYQVKGNDGFTVAQFLTENEANVFMGCSSSLPIADQHIGEKLAQRRRGYTTRRIRIYPTK